MVDRENMSVEEMLAHCRGSGGAVETPAEPVAPEPVEDAPAAVTESEPVAEQAAPAAPVNPAAMSVADMLAAARGSGEAKPAAKVVPKAAAKSAPKSAPKAAPKPAAEPSGPMSTASILAAARGEGSAGPVSKKEAREQGQSTGAKPAKAKLVVPPMPAKPAYAQAPVRATASDRRGFMATVGGALFGSSLALGFTSLAATHLLWALGLARFMFPNILMEPPTRFKVGFPDDFAPGQVQTKFKAQFGVWIARFEYDGEPQIYALKTVCTHLGCTPNWLEGEQKFKCPCHGSGFYKDGINFEGPAPRPLERYAIKLADDGQLEVDKSRTFNQEMGQWSDAASFVTV
ncbi:MAG: Rieske (2Fe-2S) protein [Pirellulaceae bacterium]